MSAFIDDCRRAEVGLIINVIKAIQEVIIFWVTPIAFYLSPGWNLRIRRTVSTFSFIFLGLVQIYSRIRHARSIPEAIFGIADCPPGRIQFIQSIAWTFALQLCSALLWSPLSWFSRVLTEPTQFLLLRYLKYIPLVPVQILRAFFWAAAASLLFIIWTSASVLAIAFNLFVIPFALLGCLIVFQVVFLYIVLDGAYFPPQVHLAISETINLTRSMLSFRHLLQIVGKLAALCGAFGCRDRWFRRDAIRTPIAHAIQATYPGLIGPISSNETDLSDAIAALRGLKNVWQDLQTKQKFIDDRNVIVYALSYKHMPVVEDGQMIRLDQERAANILRNLMAIVRRHGYLYFMLWCDGASAAGVRTESEWVDIGLLPYAIYRTARVRTHVDGDEITTGRMWLELEKGLSVSSCGMDVIGEWFNGPKVTYHLEERIRGQGCKPMEAVLRISSRIAQGQFESFQVSREEDKADIALWARRMLLRSGMNEMNEALGWRGDPAGDRRAKALLTRISTFVPRRNSKFTEAEVVKLPGWRKARVLSNSEEVANVMTPGRTEYWLRLLGFTETEIEAVENEDIPWTSATFFVSRRGKWRLNIASLQGNYYSNVIEFEHLEPALFARDTTGVGEKWLVTNSQVEKSAEIEEWVKKLAAEMFGYPVVEDSISRIEKEWETGGRSDTISDWYSDIFGQIMSWRRQFLENSPDEHGESSGGGSEGGRSISSNLESIHSDLDYGSVVSY